MKTALEASCCGQQDLLFHLNAVMNELARNGYRCGVPDKGHRFFVSPAQINMGVIDFSSLWVPLCRAFMFELFDSVFQFG